MKNLVRSIKSWKVLGALVLVAGLAVLGFSVPKQTALAASGNGEAANIMFTKWTTGAGTSPVLFNMAGVVSGDVGGGLFVGEVLNIVPGTTYAITAVYHINGGTHQFTARINATWKPSDGTGVITGVVTDGWLKGNKVRGAFQTINPSGITNANSNTPFNGMAFQGTLRIALDKQD